MEFGKQFKTDSLFVRGYLPENDDMEPRYRNINVWKRPTDLLATATVQVSSSGTEACSGANCNGYRGK